MRPLPKWTSVGPEGADLRESRFSCLCRQQLLDGRIHAVLQDLLVPVRHASKPCGVVRQGCAPQIFAAQQGAHAGCGLGALGGAQGQATDIDIQAREILSMRQRLNEILAKHCGQSVETIGKDTDRDKILTAADALKAKAPQ